MLMRVIGVVFIVGIAIAVQAQETQPRPARSAEVSVPPPAWQGGDEVLAAKWKQITGRYIFQQACTECHGWGPNRWPRERWQSYLQSFPHNHQPDVRDRYKD